MFIIMLHNEKQNSVASYIRPMKIKLKIKPNPSNNGTQMNRFLVEIIEIIFKNLKCLLILVF